MNNTGRRNGAEGSSLNKPNAMSVSLRLAVLAAALFGAYKAVCGTGVSSLGFKEYLICGLLGSVALVVLGQLCVWGLKWVKHERVSELGLHIVRFAVILFAVMTGIFVMLSVDYTKQYDINIGNELKQQALAGRIYVQDAIGSEVRFTSTYTAELEKKLDNLLISDSDVTVNRSRYVNLYLFTDGEEVTYDCLGGSFDYINTSHTIVAVGSDSRYAPAATEYDVTRVRNSGSCECVSYKNEDKSGDKTYLSALAAVYTTDGKPVGVLEVCQTGNDITNVFSFSSLELFLRMAAFVCLFSFGFYGMMQLVDIGLRPSNFDKSRMVLSCGREAARPILFFAAFTAALPLMLLIYSDSFLEAAGMNGSSLAGVIPALIYIIGILAALPLCGA